MAEIEDFGLVKKGASLSARNARIIDRSQVRGPTMQSNAPAFHVFQGAVPDYYINGELVVTNGPLVLSQKQWENGNLHYGAIPSGTVLEDPRAYSADGTPVYYTVSGDITITVSGDPIKTFVL